MPGTLCDLWIICTTHWFYYVSMYTICSVTNTYTAQAACSRALIIFLYAVSMQVKLRSYYLFTLSLCWSIQLFLSVWCVFPSEHWNSDKTFKYETIIDLLTYLLAPFRKICQNFCLPTDEYFEKFVEAQNTNRNHSRSFSSSIPAKIDVHREFKVTVEVYDVPHKKVNLFIFWLQTAFSMDQHYTLISI